MSENRQDLSPTAKTAPDQQHPAWCDPSRCTAEPSTQADGYRSGVGGEHRSADLPLAVRPAVWPTPDRIEAFLTEAIAPWRCATFLRIMADGEEVASIPAESAAPILAALSELVASAVADWEVER
ncbi:hypothetical protein [Actinoplanes flavus]|uniref:Uncharacterized protein n=1 Tax=Actinoplanes flavus TaxID=2820290 RepID=A0ABS3UJV8_9ACTN|nr:hypothetical protein [Actinoplanes flavus]MBO3737987.1 hypothetical protein [Actinoplanes flavus]